MDSACKYISYLKTMEKHIEGTPFAGMFYTAKAFYELKANRDFSKGISLLIKSYNEFENYNDIENMVIRIPQRQHFPRFGAGAVVRFSAAPSSRCSKAVLRSGRIPQRQHLPRSDAGAADGREEEIASRVLASQAQPFCNVQHITKIYLAYYQGYTFWQLAGPGIFRYQTAILPHIFTSPADVFSQSA